ncbi:MAG: hypothetical protein SFW67_03015 [Myxococcaceae bacterium]|nr:hypothetical protein [Myxococcaceae bacterium]
MVFSAGVALASTSAAAPEVSLSVGGAAFPASKPAARLDASIVDVTGERWDLSRDVSAGLVAPGLSLGLRLRFGSFTAALEAALAFASFANESGKTGQLYGATLALPLGVHRHLGPFEVTAFVGPLVVFGGFGLGTLSRREDRPIDFGSVRYFDDETALHLVDTSVGLVAGGEVRVPLRGALSAFVQVGGQLAWWTARSFNLAGYTDEAQSRVEWSPRPLNDSAISSRLGGRSLDDVQALSFSGPRLSAGLAFTW